MKNTLEFKKEHWFAIAKIIDGDFRGSEKTFTHSLAKGHYLLTTNRTDSASLIRIHINKEFDIYGITRLGEDTEGWVSIQPGSMERVINYIKSLNKTT